MKGEEKEWKPPYYDSFRGGQREHNLLKFVTFKKTKREVKSMAVT